MHVAESPADLYPLAKLQFARGREKNVQLLNEESGEQKDGTEEGEALPSDGFRLIAPLNQVSAFFADSLQRYDKSESRVVDSGRKDTESRNLRRLKYPHCGKIKEIMA